MKKDMVAEQAANAGDALHESSYDLSDVEDAAESKEQEKNEQENQNNEQDNEQDTEQDKDHEHAVRRKSDKEWQMNKEKAAKLDKLLESLGMDEETTEEEDPLEAVQKKLAANEKEVQALREESKRKDFERETPAAVSEKYKEEWEQACKDKLDPDHKYSKLDYSEIWKLIRRDDPQIQQAKKELEKSESNPFSGSVPPSGSQVEDFTASDAQSQTQKLMIEEMGYSSEDFK